MKTELITPKQDLHQRPQIVFSNVPVLESKLKQFIHEQHEATNGRIPVPGAGGWPTMLLVRDRGLSDYAAVQVYEMLGTEWNDQHFDTTDENGTYFNLEHHVLDDEHYKRCFTPIGNNPFNIFFIGSRVKQVDSAWEHLARKLEQKCTIDIGFGEDVIGIHDMFGIKIITEDYESAERVVERLKVIGDNPWNTQFQTLNDIDDKYRHPVFHTNVNNTELGNKFGRNFIPAYRAFHIDVEIEHPLIGPYRVEIQVVDKNQWRYNYAQHKGQVAGQESYAHNRLASGSTGLAQTIHGFNKYVFEGSRQLWEESPQDSKVQIVKPHRRKYLNGGKVLLVRQPIANSYIHFSPNGYEELNTPHQLS